MVYFIFKLICVLTVFIIFKFNPIQDGHFWGFLRIGKGKNVCHSKICHTYSMMMKPGIVRPYLKKIHEIYKSRQTPSWVLLTSAFFNWKLTTFVISKIEIEIEFWYTISNSFKLFGVFKGCSDRLGFNFDDVSKLSFSRPS